MSAWIDFMQTIFIHLYRGKFFSNSWILREKLPHFEHETKQIDKSIWATAPVWSLVVIFLAEITSVKGFLHRLPVSDIGLGTFPSFLAFTQTKSCCSVFWKPFKTSTKCFCSHIHMCALVTCVPTQIIAKFVLQLS